jgi:hypothetical protein
MSSLRACRGEDRIEVAGLKARFRQEIRAGGRRTWDSRWRLRSSSRAPAGAALSNPELLRAMLTLNSMGQYTPTCSSRPAEGQAL